MEQTNQNLVVVKSDLLDEMTKKLTAYEIVAEDMKKNHRNEVKIFRDRFTTVMDKMVTDFKEKYKAEFDYKIQVDLNFNTPRLSIFLLYKEGDREKRYDININIRDSWFGNSGLFIEDISWFSTTASPTKENKLIEYLRLVAELNELLLNNNRLMKEIVELSSLYNKEFIKISSFFNNINKVKSDIEDLKALMIQFDSNYSDDGVDFSKYSANDLKEIAPKINKIYYTNKEQFQKDINERIEKLNEKYLELEKADEDS